MHVWALGLLCETPALAKVEIGQSSSRPSSLGLIEKKWKVFRFPCPEAQMDVEDSEEEIRRLRTQVAELQHERGGECQERSDSAGSRSASDMMQNHFERQCPRW